MRHLVAKEHHPHLKKRAALEILGLVLLIGLSINQREIVGTALQTLRNSDVLYLLIMFGVYWLMLPLTSISYRLLAFRKIPIKTTMLAQMAGAGPGRIIPGGLGHLSIGAVHLNRCGLSMRKAAVITIANNLIGLIVNILCVAVAFYYHPSLISTIRSKVNLQTIFVALLVVVVIVSIILWLSHARSTRRTIAKVEKHWKHLLKRLVRHPTKLIGLFAIAATILFGHVCILLLAGEAIGQHISILDGLVALSSGVFIGGAIPTPGGLGAVEAGITSALILLGYDAATATGVALLFRTATYWQPLLPGIAAYFYLREKQLL